MSEQTQVTMDELEIRPQVDGSYRLPARVLVATNSYPPIPGGSCVIMKNILGRLAPDSVVLARSRPLAHHGTLEDVHHQHFVARESTLPFRVERLRQVALRPLVTHRLVRLAQDHDCRAILGVYPGIMFLDVSQAAAARLSLPFVPYLHDTVAEGMASGHFARWGRNTQARVFRSAAEILVATEGMADLYRRKYGLDPTTISHIYPEPIPAAAPPQAHHEPTFFWGGAVYNINSEALRRVFRAIEAVGGEHRMVLATAQSLEDLARQGLHGERVSRVFVALGERPRYLRLLAEQGVLVLALNWPDETRIEEDELATIFPTKTPEYLASGRPIIVHCPAHYYLAEFFRSNGCGEVVSERSPAALEQAVRRLTSSAERRAELVENALTAARMFSPEVVIPELILALGRSLAPAGS